MGWERIMRLPNTKYIAWEAPDRLWGDWDGSPRNRHRLIPIIPLIPLILIIQTNLLDPEHIA